MATFITMIKKVEKKTISILGCGWLGTEVAKQLISNGHDVKGSTTSESKIKDLKSIGIDPFLINLNSEAGKETIQDFLASDVLFINIPPSKSSTKSTSYAESFSDILRLLPSSSIKHIVFISATSVYKDVDSVVTEDGEFAKNERAERLLEAENLFLALENVTTTIIRFGGLCGNGRNPVNYIKGNTNMTGASDRVNMIHLVDCIRVVEISILSFKGGIYNATADKHPRKEVFYQSMAKLFDIEAPIYVDTRKETSGKEINSTKFKNEFNFQFVFSDPLNFPK